MSNIDTVKEIYAAFGRGDVAAIVGRCASDVEWEYGAVSTGAPWLQPRHGRDGAAEFFKVLGETLDLDTFEIKHIIGDGAVVVSLFDAAGTVRQTGKRYVDLEQVHIWHFNSGGEVTGFRHRSDTMVVDNAWKGV